MWPLSRRIEATPRVEPVFNATPENPSTNLSDPAAWLYGAFGAVASSAGVSVSQESAMRYGAVFRAVGLKAGVVGSLPLDIYERTDKSRNRATKHRLYPLMHDAPNDLMTRYQWVEWIVADLMLAGNHYSIIEYDRAGRVVGLLPMPAWSVAAERKGGRNVYTFEVNGVREVLDQADVIHVAGLGFDGLRAPSPIELAGREPVGLALAMETSVGALHQNGMRPSGAVALPPKITEAGVKRLRAELDQYAGAGNRGRPLLMDDGMKWTPLQMSMDDAQTLESRRFQIAEIARIMGVPLHLLGETDKTSSWGTGIEQMTIGWQKFDLDPMMTRIEGELNRKLFEHPFYCEFNRDALNAMDAKTKNEMLNSAIMNARMTPNEARRIENRPDYDAEFGDRLYIQSATVPLESVGAAWAETPTAAT